MTGADPRPAITPPEHAAYAVELLARTPEGTHFDLGTHWARSAQRALDQLRWRTGHVAVQLGAPYATALREWQADTAEYQRALNGLTAGIPYTLETDDADGCRYTFTACRPGPSPRTPLRT